MKTVHCSTDEFVEKMESYKFIRTSLYSGVMCGVEYTTTEPPELIEGFVESKIKEVIEALDPKETIWAASLRVAVLVLICFAPLLAISFVLE